MPLKHATVLLSTRSLTDAEINREKKKFWIRVKQKSWSSTAYGMRRSKAGCGTVEPRSTHFNLCFILELLWSCDFHFAAKIMALSCSSCQYDEEGDQNIWFDDDTSMAHLAFKICIEFNYLEVSNCFVMWWESKIYVHFCSFLKQARIWRQGNELKMGSYVEIQLLINELISNITGSSFS